MLSLLSSQALGFLDLLGADCAQRCCCLPLPQASVISRDRAVTRNDLGTVMVDGFAKETGWEPPWTR